jgi:hypothetical protein
LGNLLKVHRERAGYTLAQLGVRLGRSAAHLHRLEVGERAWTSETEVVHYLASCGASHQDVAALMKFCKEVSDVRGYWLAPSAPWMCDSLRSLVFHEARANRLVNYQPEMIPGLLQTEPYIQALFCREDIPADVRQERVNARLERQKILFRNRPAKFTFIMNERALRMEVGDYKVMAEQLLAMLFFTDQWNISIRIVPAAARHRGVFDGPFSYYDFERSQPLVYVQGVFGGLFIEDPDCLESQRALLRQMVNVALDEEESRLLIATLADEFDRAEGTWDDTWRVAQEQL